MAAKTLNTSATSFITPAQILVRVDLRVVGDLCADNGVRVVSGALASNANFLAAIQDACARVELAAYKGRRYTSDDLLALAASTGVAAGGLFRLLARLTVVCLYERRTDLELKEPWIYEQALKDLERLENGDEVFPFLESENAGLPTSTVETAQDVEARNGISYQVRRLWGTRGNRRNP